MEAKKSLSSTLLKVAWMSVLLGLGMEVLFLIAAVGFNKFPAFQSIVADLVQKISWASIVCMGVAVGTTASKMRPSVMGIAGLIAAPVAFNVAKILHKSVASALSVSLPAGGAPSALVLALIKALEYAALGLLVGRLGTNPQLGLRAHAFVGLAVGIVFGGTVLLLTVNQSSAPVPFFSLVSRGINEIIFPVGCSIVLYSAQKLGDKIKVGSL